MTATTANHNHRLPEFEGRARQITRLIWYVAMAVALITVALAIPTWIGLVPTAENGSSNATAESSYVIHNVLDVIVVLFALLTTSASLIMAGILFRRAPYSRIAYATSLFLIGYSTFITGPAEGAIITVLRPTENPGWANLFDYPVLWTAWLFWMFPTGEFVPRWTRFLIVPTGLLVVTWTITETSPALHDLEGWFATISTIVFVGLWFSIPLIQVYRYWRVSNTLERQQARWVMVGIVLWIALVVTAGIGGEAGALPNGVAGMLWFIGLSMLPASLSIAILRYRLWAVDVIIRRTLTYALITLLLAGTYYGGIVLLQGIFVQITGQESPLAVVASTLGIAALFNPLRRRVQGFIDRRFDRRKYDAQQTLETFGDVARDEVNLEQLEQALVRTVDNTMQPEHVSLWLRADRDGQG